jgi:hypothetical protein
MIRRNAKRRLGWLGAGYFERSIDEFDDHMITKIILRDLRLDLSLRHLLRRGGQYCRVRLSSGVYHSAARTQARIRRPLFLACRAFANL